ncbi:A-kinase anchor protein 17A [Folsomia candida]|uniref:A-kinase anchor protein 17A n=1 Tax=Folsomia candida TaxID=158441 RepID=UPI000B8F7BAA|nr:A-kinase anchor protein 17A [Folsomia candida]
MSQIHPCQDNSELSPLYPSRGLHLKPIARLNVSVHYPELKQSLTTGGKSISSWDIMERIKSLVSPENFIFLRVVKNTLEFIRFEGDLESREILKKIITRLDGKTMKVTGFKEALKIRCAESKLIFPSKYDWDSYFRDAKNMNEMKAGERPDTIHFQNLPSKWFCEGGRPTSQDNDKPMPSEKFFRRLWSVFGEVRCVDIPVCDKYRSQISTAVRGINTFTFSNDNVFEAYVQYKDYMSFVKAMDALRGCSLFYQESPIGKYYVANIKVDFDKSKHLSDESIRKRKAERNRLSEKDNVKKTAEKLSKFEAEVKEQKQNEREKKETEKNLAKIEYKIAMEERKYLIARRKLEAIRLMDYLFETIKTNIVTTAEKKRVLKEKTKQEMKRLEKLVIQKNTKEEQEILQANKQSKPPKVRKMQSVVKVHEEDDKDDHNTTPPPQSGEPAKENQIDDSEKKVTNSGPHFDNRYLGDWELKAKSHGGSVVKVPSNYVPVSAYRGQGRGRGMHFRGRGRGISEPYSGSHAHHRDGRFEYSNNYPYPSELPPTPYNRDHRGYDYNRGPPFQRRSEPEQFQNGPEPTVRHDFSYLDELDRAYEKYFSSITKRHNE